MQMPICFAKACRSVKAKKLAKGGCHAPTAGGDVSSAFGHKSCINGLLIAWSYPCRSLQHDAHQSLRYGTLLSSGSHQPHPLRNIRAERNSHPPYGTSRLVMRSANLTREGSANPKSMSWLPQLIRYNHSHLRRTRSMQPQYAATMRSLGRKSKASAPRWPESAHDPNQLFSTHIIARPRSSASSQDPRTDNAYGRTLRWPRSSWYLAFSDITRQHLTAEIPRSINDKQIGLHFERSVKKRERYKRQIERSFPTLILETWSALSPRRQRQQWESAILFALRSSPESAVELIQTMMDRERPMIPDYAAADSIVFIACYLMSHYAQEIATPKSASHRRTDICLNLAIQYLNSYREAFQQYLLSRQFIGLITRNCDSAQLERWVRALLESNFTMSDGDKLFIARHATKKGNFGVALDLLPKLSSKAMTGTVAPVACTAILLAKPDSETAYRQQMQLLTVMLELGVRPDARMRDAIIAVALRGGDLDLAWRAHRQAIKAGLEPSTKTYIDLLAGVDSSHDINSVWRIYREAREARLLHKSPQLGATIIRATRRALSAHSAGRRYDTMLAIYAEIFDLRPLREVGITQQSYQQSRVLLLPNSSTLEEMLLAWMHICPDLHQLNATYLRWTQLSKAGTSRIALTASTCKIFHAFIDRFGQLGDQETATRILQVLLAERYPSYSSIPREVEKALKEQMGGLRPLEKADVRVWTTLMQNFARNKQFEEAEEVIRMMRDHGIEADAFLYEVLLRAYAEDQDIDKAVKTLTEKQRAGFEPDSWTTRALGRVHDRRALRDALNSMQFSESANEHENMKGECGKVQRDMADSVS